MFKKDIIKFVIQCLGVRGLVMIISMMAGEVLIHPDLFTGFLSKPHLWVLCFVETSVWLLPVILIATFVLLRYRHLSKITFIPLSILTCTGISFLFLSTSLLVYFPGKNWDLSSFNAEILFGWGIPLPLILMALIALSRELQEKVKI